MSFAVCFRETHTSFLAQSLEGAGGGVSLADRHHQSIRSQVVVFKQTPANPLQAAKRSQWTGMCLFVTMRMCLDKVVCNILKQVYGA